MKKISLIGFLCLSNIIGTSAVSFEARFNKNYYLILKNFVNSRGLVDYKALTYSKNKILLNKSVQDFSSISQSIYNKWPKKQKIAFLINAYNLFTIQLIVKNYPVNSIRNIRDAFKREFIQLLEEKISLDILEHQILRKNFNEPRIHFALVCAAVSCPALRIEPYMSNKLNKQLNHQVKQFLKSSKHYRLDLKNNILWISSILNWFWMDFKRWKNKLILDKNQVIIHFLKDYISTQY